MKKSQRVLKFLPLIFGSETSKQVKRVRNVKTSEVGQKCQSRLLENQAAYARKLKI